MSLVERWKMSRIGFVNFWLYDDEAFEFYDGKLLLRGQNGSGKSITTQSFIPFILDGDRTPSRLDPFGSSDRRMEYYFLGEEGKDEATGYLFLELEKGDGKEYRTIGIGQRAKRGKPMDFWGFLILDGRRIGQDISLFKEVGSARIPLDKRELKALLGEGNPFTDSQSEYKKLVNKHLFGFRKDGQYEQFIRLLIKVRAPKLSKEFKPTRVYEILNESLQTLTDEDLRPMVDAMEKMDEIQESLEMLNRAYADLRAIRAEYARYNQYMLSKKAQSFLNAHKEAYSAKKEYEERQKQAEELQTELASMSARLRELSEMAKVAQAERDSLSETDLEEADRRLGQARQEKEEWEGKIQRLEEKIASFQEKTSQRQQEARGIERQLDFYREDLGNQAKELEECQETLQWDGHEEARRILHNPKEGAVGAAEVAERLYAYQKLLEECKRLIHDYEELLQKYDEASKEFEEARKKRATKEQSCHEADQMLQEQKDSWVVKLYDCAKSAEYWKPAEDVLLASEERIQDYAGTVDAGKVQEALRRDYEGQRGVWLSKEQEVSQEARACEKELAEANAELERIEGSPEIEPEIGEEARNTRKRLADAGVCAVPFYKAVEFADWLDEGGRAQLEAQLENMGLLDALVVSEQDYGKLPDVCPEFLDSVVHVPEMGDSSFGKLVPSETLPPSLLGSVRRILSNIHEDEGASGSIYLGRDGRFLQGALAGRAKKEQAEFLGYLARQRKKEQKIAELKAQAAKITETLQDWEEELEKTRRAILSLETEYQGIPGFEDLNAALECQKKRNVELESALLEEQKAEARERECEEQKQQSYQKMVHKCKPYPYGRTEEEYAEALDALGEYQHAWQHCKELFLKLEMAENDLAKNQEFLEQLAQGMDDAFVDERSCNIKKKECEAQIQQYEEYLNSPEVAAIAAKLRELRERIQAIGEEERELGNKAARSEQKLETLLSDEPEKKAHLQELSSEESVLRMIFEEELSLGLVLEQGDQSLETCALEAVGQIREGDKNREYGEMLMSLNQAYQKHNGSLAKYGTSLVDCFDTPIEMPGVREDFAPLRRRERLVSTWNGKKVYLEEFHEILKTAIEETELLIQQKDRELFEDILSQTISQQLTDRIAESRDWVKDMSKLMQELDTSMGLRFSLEWKPREAENESELGTLELEQLLLRDRDLLTMEDIEKVAGHFRSKVRTEKMRLEEEGGTINYMELVRDALDYRKWFEFQMYYRQGEEGRKPLTNAAFNRFSGGEKAMAMYVPLFAAVNAQYQKAENADHPRIIALDEAFAGVDDKNISSMFELVQKMDFDYIMNSQSLWGCYETVKKMRIAELHRPMNSSVVSVIRFIWDGHERTLDVQ